MVRVGVISDELWAVIEPVLPTGEGCRGRPWKDHRQMLEGVAWRYRTGSPWRDLPECFGPWKSVWQRHRRWSADGTYERMRAAVRVATTADPDDSQVLLSIDSTSVRVHQHAAGGRFHELTGGTIE